MNREIIGEILHEKQHLIECKQKAWGLRGGRVGVTTSWYDVAFFGPGPAFGDRGD
jgi:hypothetical protein